MPVFTFEKISPPIPSVAPPAASQKPRGVLIQILDRLVEARVKRTAPEEKPAAARQQKPPQ